MYQQQINYISDNNGPLDLLKFVKDCVGRIIKSIHYRQGPFGKTSKMDIDDSSDINTEIDDASQTKEFASYIMIGLWEKADRKVIRRLVSGRQLHVRIKENQLAKISCNNLIDRVYVKENSKLYYPNGKNGIIRSLIGKCPVRLVDHYQDNITKRCGYRLTSLIIPFQEDNYLESPIPTSEDLSPPNSDILSKIVNFEGLEKLAILLFDHFKINEKLDKYQEI